MVKKITWPGIHLIIISVMFVLIMAISAGCCTANVQPTTCGIKGIVMLP